MAHLVINNKIEKVTADNVEEYISQELRLLEDKSLEMILRSIVFKNKIDNKELCNIIHMFRPETKKKENEFLTDGYIEYDMDIEGV
jgi:hypothetical protein